MKSTFLGDKFVIWKVELVADYATTEKPVRIFVNAPDLESAQRAAIVWGMETIDKGVVAKSAKLVTDCILDGWE